MKGVMSLILFLTVLAFAQAPDALVWITKTPAPAPARCQAQAHGNVRDTIYVCGGRAAGAIAIRNVNAFVPATNSWVSTLPAMPAARSHGCGDAIDTCIYAAGGFDSSGTASRRTYRFNVNRKTWDTVAAMPRAIYLTCGAKGPAMGGSRSFFVFGSQSYGDTLFEYNPGTNTWTTRVPTTRPAGRRAAAAAGTASFFYVMGGIDRNSTVLRDCWQFERRMGGTWTRLADMPGPRCVHAATAVVGDSVIYVAGGNPTSMGAACDSIVYKYNIAANTWSTDTRMPTSRGFLTLDAAGRSIFAICGINGANYFTTTEEGGWGVGAAENGSSLDHQELRVVPSVLRGHGLIAFSLTVQTEVTLRVLNSCGQTIRTLYNGTGGPGTEKIRFNVSALPDGVYFVNLTAGGSTKSCKVMILR